MGKKAYKYLDVKEDSIKETGFHLDREKVSEALFNVSNEYMGIRGFFEEGAVDENCLRGIYLNGIYDFSRETLETGYKGIVKRTHFMVNSIDFMKIRLVIDNEELNLKNIEYTDFTRELLFKNGLYTRSYIWKLKNGKQIHLRFERFLSMIDCNNAFQKIVIEASNDVKVQLSFFIDDKLKQWGKEGYVHIFDVNSKENEIQAETEFTKEKIFVRGIIESKEKEKKIEHNNYIESKFDFELNANEKKELIRYISVVTSRDFKDQHIIHLRHESLKICGLYDEYLKKNEGFFKNLYRKTDIEIEGDELDQQGIRYCNFMLNTTYHGFNPKNNLGAKGLTGEAYSGHSFWDSETYCLPYYLFNNINAAKNLILYRYNTLEEAKKRANDLDCRGACFPIATLCGKEGCTLWQHASLQLQATTGVAYALFHYWNLTKDKEFFKNYGMELLYQICLFLLDRGQYGQKNNKFGYYAVMGPDEFKMMVDNNAYTNVMGKFSFEFMLYMMENLKQDKDGMIKRLNIDVNILKKFKDASDKMYIPFDKETLLYEQNDGFYNLPHIDINSIPREEFPLYSHWTYDRIYRGDMIKQPDVLMFFFLFLSHYSTDVLKANYEYYEPRCIHESSLSPSIHSVIANEIGKTDEAINFFSFASRLDLDDYNNNTGEGIHLTSIAAAWINIVYGFGRLRSDGEEISIAPSIPSKWKSYTFRLTIDNSLLKIKVNHKKIVITNEGKPIKLVIYGRKVVIENEYETNLD